MHPRYRRVDRASSRVDRAIAERVVTIEIAAAGVEHHPVLAALLELYVYDFSEILELDVGDDGRFYVPSLAIYASDPRCHAFLVRVDGKLAGFALVQRRSRLTGDEAVTDIAEFFVMHRYRRRGVGDHVARAMFDRFPGRWEVREKVNNPRAIAFWRRVIGRYTNGRFEEETRDDERWRGIVQRFDNGGSP